MAKTLKAGQPLKVTLVFSEDDLAKIRAALELDEDEKLTTAVLRDYVQDEIAESVWRDGESRS